MPKRTQLVTMGDRAGHGATTLSGRTARTDLSRSCQGRQGARGARAGALPSGGDPWCSSSTVQAELRARLLAAEDKARHLEFALVTNRRIGIAVGILMCRWQLTEDQALTALRGHSQNHNVKLRDLADEVIYTGTL